jgi:hypothetical protein
MTEIKIEMTESDFGHLWVMGSQWQGGCSFEEQADRFETVDSDNKEPVWTWKRAYWVGDNWPAVMLARTYLASAGHKCEVIWDMGDYANLSYVILTDFVAEADRKSFDMAAKAVV